ncbi:MAG: hypothetical protein E7262_07265 [Lachnospiraceae bacterium]|nr:hypothetical protein [Lachnospiraceae bacterium]
MENDNQKDIELKTYNDEEIQNILKEYISNESCNVVFTVSDKNLDMAQEDEEFKECLLKADLLVSSANLKSEYGSENSEAGIDVEIINKITDAEEVDVLSVMLLTDEAEFAEKFDVKIEETWKDNEYIEYVGSYVIDEDRDDDLIINEINGSIPDVLLCMCESPVQEKWIIENKSKISVKLIIALGGEKEELMQKKESGIKFLLRMFGR